MDVGAERLPGGSRLFSIMDLRGRKRRRGHVDGRSFTARRYKNILAALVVDQGGIDNVDGKLVAAAMPGGSLLWPYRLKPWKLGWPPVRKWIYSNTHCFRRHLFELARGLASTGCLRA